MVDGGEMKEFVVDDYFLTGKNTHCKPTFAKGVNDELWAMVLEKAFAKRYGSYAYIAAG